MKKKLLSILIAITVIGSLSACGKGAASETSKKSDSAKETTANKSDNTLTVWYYDKNFNGTAMDEAVKIYQKKNPDFKIEATEFPTSGDLETQITTIATSGDLGQLPDIFLMQDRVIEKYVTNINNAFQPITDSGIEFDDFTKGKLAYSTIDGENYGVPFDNGTVIACYREDYLEAAGYTIDDFTDITWDDLYEKGKVVLEKTGKPLFASQTVGVDLLNVMLSSMNTGYFDEDGNVFIADNENLKKGIEEYLKMRDAGILIEVNDWTGYCGFNDDLTAGVIDGCWIMSVIQSAEDQSGKWRITNMPKMQGVDEAGHYANNGGSTWVVSSNCKNIDLACDFFANTFAGSSELYETLFPKTGALSCYIPANNLEVYTEPQEYFGGEEVLKKIVDYSVKAPSVRYGTYYAEAVDAVATAVTNIGNGADMDSELQNAQETVEFTKGE